MKINSYKILVILALITSFSCAKNPTALEPTLNELNQIPDFDDLIPDSGNMNSSPSQPLTQMPQTPQSTQFENELLKQGIQLSSRELQFLGTFSQVKFSSWATTRSLSEEQNLEKNFKRFAKFFEKSSVKTPSSAETYKTQALKFANSNQGELYLDTKFYLSSKQLLVVKWDSQSGEFVVIRSDGSVANYLISRAVKAPRYVKFDL